MVDRDCEELAQASEGLENVKTICRDVSQAGDVEAIITEVIDWSGELDALVNNAGVADFGPIDETDFARWRTVMETNLDGVFLMSQAAAPLLQKACGAVVNIASISGLRASTLRVAYGTSKAGVMHLSQQQAAEWGEHGVRVNCICPGPVRTKLAMAVHTQDIIDAYHDAIPLGRYGSEEEIGNVITFLCSEKASYVTGQVISVDGGFQSTGIGLPSLRG
jgi:NAD(P)-dependent dehydrogenase (short-subunit alcohol dehydrogenase family)